MEAQYIRTSKMEVKGERWERRIKMKRPAGVNVVRGRAARIRVMRWREHLKWMLQPQFLNVNMFEA